MWDAKRILKELTDDAKRKEILADFWRYGDERFRRERHDLCCCRTTHFARRGSAWMCLGRGRRAGQAIGELPAQRCQLGMGGVGPEEPDDSKYIAGRHE